MHPHPDCSLRLSLGSGVKLPPQRRQKAKTLFVARGRVCACVQISLGSFKLVNALLLCIAQDVNSVIVNIYSCCGRPLLTQIKVKIAKCLVI